MKEDVIHLSEGDVGGLYPVCIKCFHLIENMKSHSLFHSTVSISVCFVYSFGCRADWGKEREKGPPRQLVLRVFLRRIKPYGQVHIEAEHGR